SVNKISQEQNDDATVNKASVNYFSFAEIALQQNDIEAAIIYLKNADISAPDNIYIKEKLLEILGLKAFFNAEYRDMVIKLGEDYYSRKLYSEKILSILAEIYGLDENPKKAKKFYKLAIKTKPSIDNLVAYYIFQEKFYPPADQSLLEKALEFPWENKEKLLRIAKLISDIDLRKGLEIYKQVYAKWNDEKTLTSLLTAHEKLGNTGRILELIQERINENKDVSDPLKTFLIGKYYTTRQYEKVIENKDLCFKVNTTEILKFLFFSAIHLDNVDIGIRAGRKVEEINDMPEDVKPTFYSYFGKLFMDIKKEEKAVEYFIKCNNVNVLRNLILEYNLETDEEKNKLKNTFELFYERTENKEFADYLLGIFYTRLEEKEKALIHLNNLSLDFLKENELLIITAAMYLQNSLNLQKAKELLEESEITEFTSNEIIAGMLIVENDSLSFSILKNEIRENPTPHISTFIRYSFLAEKYDSIENLVSLMEKGVKLFPNDADILNALGYLIAKNNMEQKYSYAETLLKKALDIDPENEMIWDSLAWLYFKMGETKKAIKAMKIPLTKKIENSEIAYHLGEIYLKLNKKNKAKKYLKLAVELGNEDESVKLSNKLLKTLFKEK
ncbi:MAG: hypothetical protein K8R49_08595, partial [Candidatus Cloacimonetes bacterium]|nr:hypothetical protein [Candidatus Cloacimonadota bacterium]